MLMLMRSEGGSEVSDETDCDDPLVVLACNSDSDACPAACKEDSNSEDEDAVVAVLVATIEFYKQTGKEAVVKSIKRIED